MPVSEADKRANAKYKKAKYDQILTRVPKGRKEEIISHAKAVGQPLNVYIIQAINERIEREKGVVNDESN